MAILNDNIVSLATDLGQRSAQRTFVASRRLTDKTLSTLYNDNWIVRKYIDLYAQEMCRLDRDIKTELDPEVKSRMESAWRRLGIHQAREEMLSWVSLYGDAMVVAITSYENGDTPDNYLQLPLDLSLEKIDRFIVLDKTAYTFDRNNNDDDITSANFGKPRMYRVQMNSTEILIHNSRVCRIEAGKRSFREKQTERGKYGRSDVQAIHDALFDYLASKTNISDIVDQSKTDVLKVEGFNQAVAAGMWQQFSDIATAMNSIRSSTNALMLDAGATWEQKELTFTGLTEILAKFRDDLCGATNMPLTKLFGQSASGFASGEEDAQNWYEAVASRQESRLRPIDEFFDMFVLDDLKIEHKHLDFSYPSIELPNDTEESTILVNTSNALLALLGGGVVTEGQVATELKNKGLVSSITDEHIEELESLYNESYPTKAYTPTEIAGGEAEQASGNILPQANDFTR